MSDLQQRFDEFDAAHPKVWELFCSLAFRAINAGHERFSSDAICHQLRWHYAVEARNDGFKLNNSFSAYYARKFHREFPGYEGFFETRRLRSDQPITGAAPHHDRAVNA